MRLEEDGPLSPKDPNVIKGDLAKAMSPNYSSQEDVSAELTQILESDSKGYRAAKIKTIPDPTTENNLAKTSSVSDELDQLLKIDGIRLGIEDKKGSDSLVTSLSRPTKRLSTRFGSVPQLELTYSDIAKPLLTALSVGENSTVKGLYKAAGLPNKADWEDYTYTNLFKDLYKTKVGEFKTGPRRNDEAMLEGLGLAASIVFDPLTYLSLGSSAVAKIGLKTSLTKKGTSLVTQIAASRTEKTLAQEALKLGKEVPADEAAKIARETLLDTEQEVLKRFGEINEVNKNLTLSKEVADLPKSALSRARLGIKFEVPFTGTEVPVLGNKSIYKNLDIKYADKTIVPGEEVAKTALKSGVIDVLKSIQSSSVKAAEKVAPGTVEDISRQYKGMVREFGSPVAQFFKDLFGERGIKEDTVNYFRRIGSERASKIVSGMSGDPKKMADAQISLMAAKAEEFAIEQGEVKRKAFQMAEDMFGSLSKKEQKEFSETLLKTSIESEQLLDYTKRLKTKGTDPLKDAKVAVKHENPKIQNIIDMWVGQGKFEGKGMMDALGERADILDFKYKKLPIWFPGIREQFAGKLSQDLIKKTSLDETVPDYLKTRVKDEEGMAMYYKEYTRDPVLAVGHRLTEMGYHELTHKFYKYAADPKNGISKEFSSFDEAIKAGYQPIRESLLRDVSIGKDLAERKALKNLYVKQEFAQQYRELTEINAHRSKIMGPAVDIIAYPTQYWKQAVLANPAYFVRNILGNSYMMAIRGINPVDPGAVANSIGMALSKPLSKPPKGGLDRFYHAAVNLYMGGDALKTKYISDINEPLVLENLLKEAEAFGAIKKGQYVADFAGQKLDKSMSEMWGLTLASLNPFSRENVAFVAAQKLGDVIETQARLQVFLHHRMRGLNPKLAAIETNETLLDYAAITGLEKTLNKTLIPFYTFSRQNLRNHWKVFTHRPGAIAAAFKVMRDTGPTDEEFAKFPDHIKRRYAVKLYGEYYSNFGLPIEDIIDWSQQPDRILAQLNPALRYAIEMNSGRDLMSDREIVDINSAREFTKIYAIATSPDTPDFIKKPLIEGINFLGLHYQEIEHKDGSFEKKLVGDPNMLHILRSSPSTRMQSLFGVLNDQQLSGLDKALKFWTGITHVKADPDLQLAIAKKKAMKTGSKLVRKYNIARSGASGVYFYGDELGAELANDMMEEIGEAESEREIHRILKGYFKEFQKEAKSRELKYAPQTPK